MIYSQKFIADLPIIRALIRSQSNWLRGSFPRFISKTDLTKFCEQKKAHTLPKNERTKKLVWKQTSKLTIQNQSRTRISKVLHDANSFHNPGTQNYSVVNSLNIFDALRFEQFPGSDCRVNVLINGHLRNGHLQKVTKGAILLIKWIFRNVLLQIRQFQYLSTIAFA